LGIPALVIAGTHSGVGKTTVAVGLMAALRNKGLRVQPFKVGPDYIDPGFHTLATGRISRNLDGWMFTGAGLKELFTRATRDADLALIEGVMGLFDGAEPVDEVGSTAQVAKKLGAPVLLVVDAQGMARSAAAMVLGYLRLDPDLKVGAVLFNKVGGEGHFRLLCDAVASTGVPVVGYLPKDEGLKIQERHLGLVPTQEGKGLREHLDRLAARIAQSVDLGALMRVARGAEPVAARRSIFPQVPRPVRARIGLARDRAFHFYYQDGLDLLQELGAELVEFSPLQDEKLPEEVDALYIGGGFPEVFARELAENEAMKRSIKRTARCGLPVYAECGGLMYLSEGITGLDGVFAPMVGLLPGRTRMQRELAALGYVRARALADSPVARKGDLLVGHEFHWSTLDPGEGWRWAYRFSGRRAGEKTDGYAGGSILASYLHIHFGANREACERFLAAAAAYRARLEFA